MQPQEAAALMAVLYDHCLEEGMDTAALCVLAAWLHTIEPSTLSYRRYHDLIAYGMKLLLNYKLLPKFANSFLNIVIPIYVVGRYKPGDRFIFNDMNIGRVTAVEHQHSDAAGACATISIEVDNQQALDQPFTAFLRGGGSISIGGPKQPK